MYRASTSIEQTDALQRDALISALKKELYDLQDKQHDFIAVNDEANNLESKYSLLKDQKERIENQHRVKADINRKNISEFRAEIDSLKIQAHKCSVSIEDILRESQSLRRASQNRENEIAAALTSNQDTEAKNEQLEEDNRTTFNKIRSLKQQRNKIDIENQRLQTSLQEAITALKNLEKQARFLESSNNKLSSMLLVAEKDHSDEMRSRDDLVNVTNKKLDQLNKQIQELKDKINRLDKQCIKNTQQLSKVGDQLEGIVIKNKQQAKRVKQAENSLRGIQNELDRAVLERDALEGDNAALNEEHKLLNSEIDSLLLQIIDCQRVNNQMKREIENYLQYDEEARSMLDRKAAMRSMLQTVNTKLGQTSSSIAHLR